MPHLKYETMLADPVSESDRRKFTKFGTLHKNKIDF